jgi:peptide/nickel transport system substrate-binding protein
MARYLFIILSLVLIGGLIISGCSAPRSTTTQAATTSPVKTTTQTTTSSPANTTTSTTASPTATPTGPQPVVGGTLRILYASSPRNLGDPSTTGTSGRTLVAEPLTLLDSNGNLIPWLVTSWDLNPDTKTMTFKLRQGVKFHDGTEFNAEAVKWNWEQRISYGGISGANDLKSIDVVDPYTVRLSFNSYSVMYIFSFTHVCPIYSPTAFKTNGKDWAKTHAVGTGPFKQADFKADSYLKLVRNDDYWGTRPYLDGMTYTYVSDATVASLMMRNKDGDMWIEAPGMQTMELRDQGLQVIQRRAALYFIGWDSANTGSIFSNIKVRQALEYALNRNPMAAVRGLGGGYEPLYQFATPQDKGYNPDIQARNYDPQKAMQLLAEAGYPNGFKTKLLCNNDQTTQDNCVLVQAYLRAINVNVTLDVADSARRLSMVGVGGTGWTDELTWGNTGVNAGLDYVRWTLCNTFNPAPKSWYISLQRSPAFVDIYNRTVTAPTVEKAEDLARLLVKQMFDDAMAIPVWDSPFTVVAQKYVHTNLGSIHHQIWNPELDWMEKH